MPELDELVAAMRSAADALPAAPLMPGVRSRAGSLRRRRVIASVAAAVVAVGTVLGVGYLALDQSRRQLPAGQAKPDLSPADLVGPTWTLVSWTTAKGETMKPPTGRPLTLTFDSQTAAHSSGGVKSTWSMRLGKGSLFGVEGLGWWESFDPLKEAEAAMSSVLSGSASWRIVGDTLVIRRGSGESLTFTRAATVATQSSSSATAAEAETNTADLLKPIWSLVSWTTSSGNVVAPATDRLPTLEFESPSAAHTDDSRNLTAWTTQLAGGRLTAVQGDTETIPESTASQAVGVAMSRVLAGTSTWQITGSTLLIQGHGMSLLLASSPDAVPDGSVRLALLAEHVTGTTTKGTGPVSGQVALKASDGRSTYSLSVERAGSTLSLAPGRYVVSATVRDGTCKPTELVVRSGELSSLTMQCRDGLSTG